MGYVVRLPQLGMTMEEGVVVEWVKDLGEGFEEGDVIAVVESEKTTNDVTARASGQFLEYFVDPLESVEPGDPIAYVGEEGESVPENVDVEADSDVDAPSGDVDATTGATETGDAAETGTVTTVGSETKISPRALSHAHDNGIDETAVATLDGSGPDGAVIEQDVIELADDITIDNRRSQESTRGQTVSEDVVDSGRDIYQERGTSGLRRTIADRMTQSNEAPQVTLNRRANVDSLLNLKEQLEADRNMTLSVTDFLLSAVVSALQEHPAFNGIYEDGVHKLARKVNIGVAVDIEDGLVAPVINGADSRTIAELREERRRLVSLVQSGEYTMDDLSNGTFTVTNLGHFGVETFDPLLNPPQVAILGVGEIRSNYDPEAGGPRSEIGLSLTFDHRAVDGADAARFLATLADELEHPLRLVPFGRDQTRRDGNGPFDETSDGPEGGRVATATLEDGMQAAVRSRHFEWAVDEPEDRGGDDTAPSPVEQFIGSLSSCLTLMIDHMADRREVEPDDVTVTAQAHPPEGRIERIDVDIHVVSDADEETVEQIVELAERACYVNQIIDSDVERDLSITIE